MSSFVVEDSCINGPLSYLQHWNGVEHIARQLSKATGFDVRTDSGCEQLGRAMYDLNWRAVEGRYGEKMARESWKIEGYEFRFSPSISLVQAYKSLTCWHYQCCEDATVDDPLYKTMGELISSIACSIVSELPEYDRAKWGGMESNPPRAPKAAMIPVMVVVRAQEKKIGEDLGMTGIDAPF